MRACHRVAGRRVCLLVVLLAGAAGLPAARAALPAQRPDRTISLHQALKDPARAHNPQVDTALRYRDRLGGAVTVVGHTGSMSPVLEGNDILVVEAVGFDALRVGDILLYRGTGLARHGVWVHRVIARDEATRSVRTQGDNNGDGDRWPIGEDRLVARVRYVVEWPTGRVRDFAHDPRGAPVDDAATVPDPDTVAAR